MQNTLATFRSLLLTWRQQSNTTICRVWTKSGSIHSLFLSQINSYSFKPWIIQDMWDTNMSTHETHGIYKLPLHPDGWGDSALFSTTSFPPWPLHRRWPIVVSRAAVLPCRSASPATSRASHTCFPSPPAWNSIYFVSFHYSSIWPRPGCDEIFTKSLPHLVQGALPSLH